MATSYFGVEMDLCINTSLLSLKMNQNIFSTLRRPLATTFHGNHLTGLIWHLWPFNFLIWTVQCLVYSLMSNVVGRRQLGLTFSQLLIAHYPQEYQSKQSANWEDDVIV